MIRQCPIGYLVTSALLMASPFVARGQSSFLGSFTPLRSDGRGLQFSGISASAGYSTQPFSFGISSLQPTQYRGAAVDYGLSTGASWSRSRSLGSMSFRYSFAYNRM